MTKQLSTQVEFEVTKVVQFSPCFGDYFLLKKSKQEQKHGIITKK